MSLVYFFTRQSSLYSVSFLVRAFVMYAIIQPHGFYKQPDTPDYHACALSITYGHGMHHIQTKEPVFWRTPGYPLFLSFFYGCWGKPSLKFEDNRHAQLIALWVQILVSSLVPLIIFLLAHTITGIHSLSYLIAWITALHPGFVLASTLLLTEGIALLFFYLFLFYLYRVLFHKQYTPWLYVFTSAISLSAYTWMRPMGEFIGYVTSGLLLFTPGNAWQQRIRNMLLFIVVFGLSLFPWYYRNYRLTGEWFFCPTIGTYLNCFSVPKILRRTLHKPLIECHKIAQQKAAHEIRKEKQTHPHKIISNSICKRVAYPIVQQYPLYFAYDWITEVVKTTGDLYSYQWISMINDTFWYDPLEEYLPEKISDCLWNHPMPWYCRVTCWIEFLYSIILWIGLFGGLWVFVISSFISRVQTADMKFMRKVWLTIIPMIGAIVGMTGGFGYARLRLPAEPLMLILSALFWYWLYQRVYKKEIT